MPEEKCEGGRPLRHRGRCAGAQKKKRGEISTAIAPMRIPLNLPKHRPNIARTGPIDELLADLVAKKNKIEAAIAALRELYGLES